MKSYLIDLDGTMYRGNENIDGAREFIAWCIAKQQPFYFLTNNATRTRLENVQHMEKLGFKGIREDQFFTSSMAAARTMQKFSTKRNAYMIGQAGLREALLDAGFKLVEEDVDFVFVGLDGAVDAAQRQDSNDCEHHIAADFHERTPPSRFGFEDLFTKSCHEYKNINGFLTTS